MSCRYISCRYMSCRCMVTFHCYEITSTISLVPFIPFVPLSHSFLLSSSQICKLFSSYHIMIPFAPSFDLSLQFKTVPHPIILLYHSLCTLSHPPLHLSHSFTLPHIHHCCALTPVSVSCFHLLLFFEVVLKFFFFLLFAYFISPYSTSDKIQPVFVQYRDNGIGFASNMTCICFHMY
jgi:hypothetical protein